jgi:hypothetical protein
MARRKIVVEIDDELDRKLAAMPPRHIGPPRKTFTEGEDRLLLKWKPVRTWRQLEEVFGCGEDTLRRRYRELTSGQVAAPRA